MLWREQARGEAVVIRERPPQRSPGSELRSAHHTRRQLVAQRGPRLPLGAGTWRGPGNALISPVQMRPGIS